MSYALLPERTLRLLSLRGKRYLPKGMGHVLQNQSTPRASALFVPKIPQMTKNTLNNLHMWDFFCTFAPDFGLGKGKGQPENIPKSIN